MYRFVPVRSCSNGCCNDAFVRPCWTAQRRITPKPYGFGAMSAGEFGFRFPAVRDDEFGLVAVADIALWADGFSMAEMRIVARDIRDRLYELNGIRKIDLYGVHDEQVFLDFSMTRLAQFGITGEQVINTLVEQNVVLPGGTFDAANQDIIVEPSGNFQSVEDIENVEITIPDTRQTIRLKDIVDIDSIKCLSIVGEIKNDEPRLVPLNDRAVEILNKMPKVENNEYIFASPVNKGEPIKEIKKPFKKALKKAGIKDFRFHDLRHTFASHFQMATNDQRGLGELLGHKTSDMTRRYTHLSLKHKKEGMDALFERLNQTAPKLPHAGYNKKEAEACVQITTS